MNVLPIFNCFYLKRFCFQKFAGLELPIKHTLNVLFLFIRIEELKLTKTDHDKMNHILNEKNSQLGYLRETIEQYEKDVAHMETR